jgi:hypothetical protein
MSTALNRDGTREGTTPAKKELLPEHISQELPSFSWFLTRAKQGDEGAINWLRVACETRRACISHNITSVEALKQLHDSAYDMVSCLSQIRSELEKLPEGYLGTAREYYTHPDGEGGEMCWSIRDKLIDDINRVLRAATGLGNINGAI